MVAVGVRRRKEKEERIPHVNVLSGMFRKVTCQKIAQALVLTL